MNVKDRAKSVMVWVGGASISEKAALVFNYMQNLSNLVVLFNIIHC